MATDVMCRLPVCLLAEVHVGGDTLLHLAGTAGTFVAVVCSDRVVRVTGRLEGVPYLQHR